jgi:dihydrofolate reductase
VKGLKAKPGGDIMVWGSLSVARHLAEAGLVDSYQLRVLPVSIGEGVTTFPDTPGQRKLKLVAAKPYPSGVVSLSYDVSA